MDIGLESNLKQFGT